MLKIIGVFLSLFMMFKPALAASFNAEEQLRPYMDEVMKKVAAEDLTGFFGMIKPHVAIPDTEFQLAELNSKNQKIQYAARYGFTVGVEFIEQKKVGESLIKMTYIEKTQKQALPWIFYFYKPSGAWILTGFKWSDQLLMPLLDGK